MCTTPKVKSRFLMAVIRERARAFSFQSSKIKEIYHIENNTLALGDMLFYLRVFKSIWGLYNKHILFSGRL